MAKKLPRTTDKELIARAVKVPDNVAHIDLAEDITDDAERAVENMDPERELNWYESMGYPVPKKYQV